MTTTAAYRKQAQDHEARLEWDRAAYCWDKAIEAYPSRGPLAEFDKSKMLARYNACMDTHNAESIRRSCDTMAELAK